MKRLLGWGFILALLGGSGLAHASDLTLFSVAPGQAGAQDYNIKLQILLFMTLLSLLPTLLLMMTSFTRIIIVLAILRQALGLQSSPPNRVLIGIALTLTLLIMRPVWQEVYTKAFVPFDAGTLTLPRRWRWRKSRCAPSCWPRPGNRIWNRCCALPGSRPTWPPRMCHSGYSCPLLC